jgi:hypothetical protein
MYECSLAQKNLVSVLVTSVFYNSCKAGFFFLLIVSAGANFGTFVKVDAAEGAS